MVSEERVWLVWLVRLRWVAIIAQIVTLSFASRILATPVLVFPLLLVTALLVVGNMRAIQVVARPAEVPQDSLVMQLSLDVISLTAYFALAGGPDNPFTSLYLIHIAMGGVMLRQNAATFLMVWVLACYAGLHAVHLPLDLAHHTFSEQTLIRLGRIVSFTITTGSVAVFVVGITNSLRRRERQLLEARDKTAATDRLRALGTLAAGAAHEINTPLSTMGLRLRRIGRRYEDPDTVGDIEAIRGQLERVTGIVDRLLIGAGDPTASDIDKYPAADLVAEAVKWWSKGADTPVRFDDSSDGALVEVPRVAFTQGLVNLLENAREAQGESGSTDAIEVLIVREAGEIKILVRDHGCGLPDQSQHRIGDPFFTTKATGTGLGVFVARAVADGSGGGLRYSQNNRVTEAEWHFPEAGG